MADLWRSASAISGLELGDVPASEPMMTLPALLSTLMGVIRDKEGWSLGLASRVHRMCTLTPEGDLDPEGIVETLAHLFRSEAIYSAGTPSLLIAKHLMCCFQVLTTSQLETCFDFTEDCNRVFLT